jgi:hypothetical protein
MIKLKRKRNKFPSKKRCARQGVLDGRNGIPNESWQLQKPPFLLELQHEGRLTIEQIEMTNHTITISDIPDFNKRKFYEEEEDDDDRSDDENEKKLEGVNKKEKKLKVEKELSKINEHLSKLEKKKF